MDARFGPSAATRASIHSPARLALRTAAPLRRTLALVCALYASGALAAASDTADPGRFKVAAALSESAVSGDGRYAVQAELRHVPEARTADQRFSLKAVNVPAGGCNALGEDVFSNGFEGP